MVPGPVPLPVPPPAIGFAPPVIGAITPPTVLFTPPRIGPTALFTGLSTPFTALAPLERMPLTVLLIALGTTGTETLGTGSWTPTTHLVAFASMTILPEDCAVTMLSRLSADH